MRRPRLPGVSVKPGSVRQARKDADLSLAQVAAGYISRGAIHLIETGRSRPSMQTLELIARRTKRPISYFLAAAKEASSPIHERPVDPRIDELEQLCLAGDLRSAVDKATGLLEGVHDAWTEAKARFYLGQALVRLSRLALGETHLSRARALFEQLGDQWLAVECLDWEASALYLQEKPEALPLAEEALRRCRGLTPVPVATEVRILGHIAAIHLSRHDSEKAIQVYEAAIDAAGSIRDLSRLARMYSALSVAHRELGNLSHAATYSHKALALATLERDQASVAVSENNLGLVLLQEGQLEAAEGHLRRSLEICDELRLERGKSHVLLSLGELFLLRGGYADAEGYFLEGVALAERLGERMTLALAHQFLGRLAALNGSIERTDDEFGKALALLADLKVPERLMECRTIYATVLEERGDLKSALEQWKMAVSASRPRLVRPEPLDSYLLSRPAEQSQ